MDELLNVVSMNFQDFHVFQDQLNIFWVKKCLRQSTDELRNMNFSCVFIDVLISLLNISWGKNRPRQSIDKLSNIIFTFL